MGDPSIPKRLKWEHQDILHSGLISLKVRFFGDKTIFVNPYCDMFALEKLQILEILEVCGWSQEENNTQFIFQTKNPEAYFGKRIICESLSDYSCRCKQ